MSGTHIVRLLAGLLIAVLGIALVFLADSSVFLILAVGQSVVGAYLAWQAMRDARREDSSG